MQNSVFCMVVSRTRLIQAIACFLSLYKNMDNFKVYILCVDEKCYEFLKEINSDKIVLVTIAELNREDLLAIKASRKLNQYCWTLKPGFIKHIFTLDDSINRVTYIDSDLFFYQNPNVIFENQPDASVLLSSGEIFLPMYSKEFNQTMQTLTGNFNSGFISFKKDINGLQCVNWWDKMCVDSCTSNPEDNKFGDQKYLDDMPFLFNNVYEITTQGINIGHWNYLKYKFTVSNDNVMVNNNKLIFYHFSGFRIISKYDIRQVHEEDRVNIPFIYQIYKRALGKIIDDVEKIDPNFKEYITVAAVDDN
ncbi:hypothetical protein CSBG_00719 [Clostridium sp. 7_2_43FAA]|jgi:hypothetical protein|uniref:Nucleotide-diphospho-sugar transferase n=2 Tax=Clostridiaceae TaxID=31979 RepID=A0A9X3XG62_9CLOT|nr:hypothetical protein [Clostridium tertium]EEH97093.2 hypothetical protein CSBG_00719 [Clostridium sp. 7_2_43FAA]MBS5306673.1 hypothetical protein [Clostridium sp.]MBU6134627.1 hypothetical protein [Clostridium tertium]MDC4238785.1 hypothetical protein [Clostridium tertium]